MANKTLELTVQLSYDDELETADETLHAVQEVLEGNGFDDVQVSREVSTPDPDLLS